MVQDGKQMKFPTIAIPQALKFVSDAAQSNREDLPSIGEDPLTISQPIFTGFLNPHSPGAMCGMNNTNYGVSTQICRNKLHT